MTLSEREFLVACLCAEWCEACRAYREGFLALAGRFPQAEFLWIDIEERETLVGDYEVENFPTVLVQRGAFVLFYGVLPPQHAHLQRLVEEFCRQSPEESRAWAVASEQRRALQASRNLRAALAAAG